MLQLCCRGSGAVPIETCSDGFSCVDRGGDALPQCVGSDAGTGTIAYVGCTYVGGYDRVVIAKRDTARDLCFNVILKDGGAAAVAGLTVPASWGLEASLVTSATTCPSRNALTAIPVSKTVGAISWVDFAAGSSTFPAHASIDAAVVFAPSSGGISANEKLTSSNVDVSPTCP